MPRKSTAELLVPPTPKRELPRPDVPYDLNEAEGAVWHAVVDTMPADYFTPAQIPMLKIMCQMSVDSVELKAQLDAEKAKKRVNHKRVEARRREWVHATSMRLTQQAAKRLETTRHPRGKQVKNRWDRE